MQSLSTISRLIPVPHGFSRRQGGVSEAPLDSLNIGLAVGDRPQLVEENRRRLLADAGLSVLELRMVHQVHGDRMLDAEALGPSIEEADALFTRKAGRVVGVSTADCVPILLVDPRARLVAAVHSGWRGTDLEITRKTVEGLVHQGARVERLLAAIGPSIQRCCYQVSDELAQRFGARFGDEVLSARNLDLPLAVELTLKKAGLKAGQIDRLEECTSCLADRYFSHRRDQGRTGRHLNFVACAF